MQISKIIEVNETLSVRSNGDRDFTIETVFTDTRTVLATGTVKEHVLFGLLEEAIVVETVYTAAYNTLWLHYPGYIDVRIEL